MKIDEDSVYSIVCALSEEKEESSHERSNPPERAAPLEREEPPVPSDPIENMTGNELAEWRRAENRLLGLPDAPS